ncbi:Do family serine endopeptidase [Moraxella sp. ZY210820]|uniref:Do family serine endopeptidase n=1 Tax=unclassified Moraxella TaxID=2685852 RepID=UPI00351E9D45
MQYLVRHFAKNTIYGAVLGLTAMQATASSVDFSPLVERVSPAVVSVNVVKTTNPSEELQIPPQLRRYFEYHYNIPQHKEESSYGSAFFISQDGYLLTNHHVVDGASHISIILNDRREIDAKLIGSDKRTDIALLKVEGTNYPSLTMGKMDTLKVGEPVLAIGSPFGFDYSASAGIVSAKSRTMSSEASVPFIQTDVALNPGNSGGPLFNRQGEVIGVNSRIFSGTGGYMGLSFSVPIDVAMDVAQHLKQTGRVSRAYLGVNLQDVDRHLAESYQFSKPKGSIITQVAKNSPAQLAGLKTGDVILTYNGHEIAHTTELMDYLYRARPNQMIKLDILRQGRVQSVDLKLETSPDDTPQQRPKAMNHSSQDTQVLGMIIRELSLKERQRLNLNGVVVFDLTQSGLASKAGLLPQDLITHINDESVQSVAEFVSKIKRLERNNVVRLTVVRQGEVAILALRLK